MIIQQLPHETRSEVVGVEGVGAPLQPDPQLPQRNGLLESGHDIFRGLPVREHVIFFTTLAFDH